MTRTTLLALLSGCVLDNELKRPGGGLTQPADTADESAPPVDTDGEETGGAETGGPSCPERSWVAEPLALDESCTFPAGLTAEPLDVVALPGSWESRDDTYYESMPVVVPLGGMASVAYTDTDQWLRMVEVSSGELRWETERRLGGDPPGAAAWGDLDGDGVLDVAAAGLDRAVAVNATGEELWTQPVTGLWAAVSSPGLADLDGDGMLEVVWGNRIYDGQTGGLRGVGAHGAGTGCCDDGARVIGVVADVDLDGNLDVVVGNALYDADANTLWYNGEDDGFVAVANFDDDDYAEIVVSGNEFVRLQDDDGAVLWAHHYFPPVPESYLWWGGGPPAIADFDADGRPEIAVAGGLEVLVLDGSSGAVLWRAAKPDDNSGFGGVSAFDIDGDGDDDVLTGDLSTLYILDGSTGTTLAELPRTTGTGTEAPVIADVTGDGHAEVLIDGTVWTSAGEPWAEARPIWNQHAFSLTNVEDDGTIPSYPEPNWLSYNSFRSATLRVPEGYRGPDLVADILEVCQAECADGELVVWIRVGNQGYGDVVTAVDVTLWGVGADGSERALATVTWTDPLPAGMWSASREVRARRVDAPLTELRLELDGGADRMAGVVEECDETNNVTRWNEAICY